MNAVHDARRSTWRRLPWLAWPLLWPFLTATAANPNGERLEIEQELGYEFDDLAGVLHGTLDCIVRKQPERCGIADFRVAHLDEKQIRALFSTERVVVSRSGRPGAPGEIRAEFSPRDGVEVGVVYFRRVRGVLTPVAVTVAIP